MEEVGPGTDPLYSPLPTVALNYQSEGRMMQLNRAKFGANGDCGYVLKPPCMCQGEADLGVPVGRCPTLPAIKKIGFGEPSLLRLLLISFPGI